MKRGWRVGMVILGVGLVVQAASGWAGEEAWTAPPEARAMTNPVARAKGIKEGKEEYEKNCGICHGSGGKGDGPGAAALNPKPKSLVDKAIQAQTDGELFWKITNGRGVMPAWKHLEEKDRWGLVHYIRSLAGKR